MYNPALPNHYRDVVFTRYVRRRQREEHEAEERQRQPNALASALSSLSASTLTDATAAAPSRLHLSAEELHQQRVKESAALGIESAVAMEQASLEAAHQRRRLEGEDARSRISSRLDKLKALAARSKTIASGAAPATGGSSTPSPSTAAEQGGKTSNSSALPPPASSSSSPSAPLTFQRSSLGAGGFVLSGAPSAAPSSSSPSAPATTRAVRGKPSSTLLLRYARANPLSSWSSEQVAQAAARDADNNGGAHTAAGDELCAAVLRQVQELCRRFGCVRDVKVRVYTSEDVASVLGVASADVAALEVEQLRVFVRYDSVTEAFKAAESLAKVPAMADGPVFSVCFYPTTRFDANTLELRADDERAIV